MERIISSKKYKEDQSKFVDWLNGVQEKNDDYFETIKKIMPIFSKFIKNCPHKKTVLTLLAFHTHLSILKNAIIDLSETNNIYSVKALYRIFLEHWLKGTYIWARYMKEKSDDVGLEYNSLGRVGEELKYGNSIKQVSAILDAETKNLDVWDTLCEYDPKLRKLNKKEIVDNTKKFEYKSIAKYIVDNKAPGAEWISMIIPEYSELSSFIHGGPGATHQYASKLYDNQFEEYKGMIRFAFNACRVFSYSVFVLMLNDLDSEKKEQILPLIFKFQDKEGMI
ncbi:MAG: hypothetical protein WC858_01765 [Parcubacteria group bacterium]|jgi:hypothetical protein